MSDFNKVILVGRLVKDPVLTMSGEKKIAKYTIANNYKYGEREGANFISCTAFGNNAEFTEKYLKQGVKILIEGHLTTGSYEKEDGTRVYTMDVIVENSNFVESKKTTGDEENI